MVTRSHAILGQASHKHRPRSSQVLLATTGIIIKAQEWPSVHKMTQKRSLEYEDIKDARGPDNINIKGNRTPNFVLQFSLVVRLLQRGLGRLR
jgi:hypothetical protein